MSARLTNACVLAATAFLVAATVAVATTWRALGAQDYLALGYLRLLARDAVARFDTGALVGAAVAVGLGLLLPGRVPPVVRRLAIGVLALAAAGRAAIAVDAWLAARGPNLVLISIDTLRADRLGTYGYRLPTSPTLDRRLAAAGVVFERAWSQSPKTTPSHMTMLTSLHPSVHRVELWDGTAPRHALAPRVITLAEALRNAGFATGAFTGGAHMERVWGFDQGFETFEECNGAELGRARRWLKHHRRERFFLFFHTYEVHDPYTPPPRVVHRFDPDYRGPLRDVVAALRAAPADHWGDAHRRFWDAVDRSDPASVRFVERLYDAGIRHMDATTLKTLLDDLDLYGLAENTLVVFTSDHGEAFLEHGRFLHDDLHHETLHVPLVLRFPGRLASGRRVDAPAGIVDLMPTVLDLLGVPAPAGLEGRSLAALARGEAAAAQADVVSEFSDAAHDRVYESVRRPPHTYVVDGGRETLYDDVRETHDRATADAGTTATLRAALVAWRERAARARASLGDPGGVVQPSDENVRRLRALGYVE